MTDSLNINSSSMSYLFGCNYQFFSYLCVLFLKQILKHLQKVFQFLTKCLLFIRMQVVVFLQYIREEEGRGSIDEL